MFSTANMTRRYPNEFTGGCAVIGRDGGGVEARKREAAVAVGGTHHGGLAALAARSGGAVEPFTLNGHAAFEGKAQFGEELDTDVVNTLDCHDVSLASNVKLRGGAR